MDFDVLAVDYKEIYDAREYSKSELEEIAANDAMHNIVSFPLIDKEHMQKE